MTWIVAYIPIRASNFEHHVSFGIFSLGCILITITHPTENGRCRRTSGLQNRFCSFLVLNSPKEATEFARKGPAFPWGPKLEAITVCCGPTTALSLVMFTFSHFRLASTKLGTKFFCRPLATNFFADHRSSCRSLNRPVRVLQLPRSEYATSQPFDNSIIYDFPFGSSRVLFYFLNLSVMCMFLWLTVVDATNIVSIIRSDERTLRPVSVWESRSSRYTAGALSTMTTCCNNLDRMSSASSNRSNCESQQ